jgi:hypothetical protein
MLSYTSIRRATVVAVLALLSLPGLPATATTTVGVPTEASRTCSVRNADSGAVHVGLRGAVRRAAPGDHLVVRGTCRAWATIDKPLSLSGERLVHRGHDTGRARIMPKTSGPGLLILPSVDAFELRPSLTVASGIMIGRTGPTREPLDPDDLILRRESPKVVYDRRCKGDPAGAAPEAAAGTKIVFYGICPGPVRIRADLLIAGSYFYASSMPVDGGPVSRSSSGRPAIKRPGDEPSIIVDPTVEDLRLVGFRIHDGFRIGAGVP